MHLLYLVLYKPGRTLNKMYCLVPYWLSRRRRTYRQGRSMP